MLPFRPSALLVDLDGTIVDSAPGILSSLAHTYEALGKPVPSTTELMRWIGPPILDSFRDFAGLDVEGSHAALEIYRAHYTVHGLFDARVFPGMADVLRAIHEAGVPMSLATSKQEKTAARILDHFGLAGYFTEITGASDDETRSSKADVVAEAMRRLAARGVDLARPLMVGDRHHDVEGAREHGIPTLFVAWGYGAPAEAAGALALVESAPHLHAALGIAGEMSAVAGFEADSRKN